MRGAICSVFFTCYTCFCKKNLKIPKGKSEVIKVKDGQNQEQDKHSTHNTTPKTKAELTQTLQKL